MKLTNITRTTLTLAAAAVVSSGALQADIPTPNPAEWTVAPSPSSTPNSLIMVAEAGVAAVVVVATDVAKVCSSQCLIEKAASVTEVAFFYSGLLAPCACFAIARDNLLTQPILHKPSSFNPVGSTDYNHSRASGAALHPLRSWENALPVYRNDCRRHHH